MQINPPSTKLASSAVFLSASIWGLYWVPLRYMEGLGLEGTWSVAILNLPAAIFLALVVVWQRQQHQGFYAKAMLIGLFTGLGISLYGCGLVYSSVVRVTLLFYLTPVWATLIGMIWLGEKAGWARWAAIAAGLTGLTLLVSGADSVSLNIGDVYGFLSGVVWAIGASLIKRHHDAPLAGMTCFQFTFTALGSILLGFIAADMHIPELKVFNQVFATATTVSILVILPSVFIIFWAQKFLFPGRVGLLMMSEVLTAVITASIFLPDEQMSMVEWFGATLIISACLIEVLAQPVQSTQNL